MTTDKRKGLLVRILLITAVFLTVHFCFLLSPEVFETWNSRTVDRLFLLRSKLDHFKPRYDETVVLVDLNLSSIRKLNNFYLDRSYHGRVIRNLRSMGVFAQLYDIIFVAKSPNEAADQELVNATTTSGNVYFGMAFEYLGQKGAERAGPVDPETDEYLKGTGWKVQVKGKASSLYNGESPIISFLELASVSRKSGFINVASDPDGVFRRLPLIVRYGNDFYPSFALRAACDYLQIAPERIVVEAGRAITLKDAKRPGDTVSRDLKIPIDSHGRMIINLVGPWGTMRHYSFADVFLASNDQDKMDIWRQELAGKIAIISESLAGSSDAGPVPADSNFPLSGLHANAVNTILTGSFLTELPTYQVLLLEWLLLIIVLAMSYQFSPPAFFFGTTIFVAGYLLVATAIFLYAGLILPIAGPLFMVALAFISIQVLRAIESARSQAAAEKARELAERELEIGRKIQTSFLPESLPNSPDWEIVAHFQPARQVAGDFYDAFELEESSKLGFVIADVCDKGVGAALFMSLFRSLIRAFATREFLEDSAVEHSALTDTNGTIEGALQFTNNYIARTHSSANMFATVFFGVLDPNSGMMDYINAGHEAPFVISNNTVKDRLMPTGPAVGVMPNLKYPVHRYQLYPGDTILAYTDGVTDAQNAAGELFGKEKLMTICEQPHDSAEALMQSVLNGVSAHSSIGDQFDDLTMIAVRLRSHIQFKHT